MRMFSGDSIEDVFNSGDIEESWRVTLLSWEGASDAQKKECLQRIHILRDYFFNTLVDIKDSQDKESCFILMYVFSRVQWILLNTRVNYTVNSKQFDNSLLYEAGMLSTLIGAMERCIPQAKVQFITHILLRSVDDIEHEADWDPDALDKNNLGGLYERIKGLESSLVEREQVIAQFESEWSLLEAGVGKGTARGILETIRDLKDLLLTGTQGAPVSLPERYQDFDREFGGLSARHISGQLARLREEKSVLESDALRWQEGQELFLRELGEASAERIVKRFRDMQDTIARLSVGAQKSSDRENVETEKDNIDDLLLGISNALSEIHV